MEAARGIADAFPPGFGFGNLSRQLMDMGYSDVVAHSASPDLARSS